MVKELNQMKKKVLFICLHRPGRSPSQRYRFEQYLSFLRSENFECFHRFLLNERNDKVYYSEGKYFQKGLILIKSILILIYQSFFKKYDLVYVQREAIMLGSSFFERKFAKKSKLIYDFDDAIWKPQIGEIKSKNKLLFFLKRPSKTTEIIKASHMVFAGNEYLANFALNNSKNVKIIPTTIDTNIYKVAQKKDNPRVCIGWTGSFSTIIHLEYILEALIKVKEKYKDKVYFKIIGDETFVNKTLGIQGIAWNESTEVADLEEIDIGIMPLPDDDWTKGKCGAKGLQYMAAGISTILSPVGVNTDIVEEGVSGYFATTQKEWVEKLSLLIDSPSLRKQIGLEGRKVVEKNYSVHANKHLYVEYFNEVLKS